MIRCDDEYPSSGHPVAVALIGAVGTVAAALAVPWARERAKERERRLELERRLARLEAAAESAEGDDE